jgi:hypothetical protein
MKTLVLYAYNERGQTFTSNLRYFLDNGVFAQQPDVTYCIVVSGASSQPIERPGVEVLRRANEGGDFGAWGYGLEKMGAAGDYDYFIFLNDTARGPYVPAWAERSEWTRFFTMRLNDKCRLVGPTKNSMISEHLQSYAFAMRRDTMQLLRDEGIFAPRLDYKTQKSDFIVAHEIRMSSLLLRAGYEVGEFFQRSNGASTTTPYFSRATLSPFEVMFVKTNVFMRFDERQLSIGGGQDTAPASGKRVVKTALPVVAGTHLMSVARLNLRK